MTLPKAGTQAPEFSAPDQDGALHSLARYKGKWILLYFYPRDNTPGCTVEACGLRDNFSALTKAGIVILGVSTDSSTSHKKFAQKHKLPFTLLADDSKVLVSLYGVWGEKKFLGKTFHGTRRASFLISPDGVITKVYEKVKPLGHAQEVLDDVRAFASK